MYARAPLVHLCDALRQRVNGRTPSLHYSNVVDGLSKLFSHEGVRGLAKGVRVCVDACVYVCMHVCVYACD